MPTPVASNSNPAPSPQRRSQRSTKGTRQSTRFVDEFHLASVSDPDLSATTNSQLAYLAELETDFDTGDNSSTTLTAFSFKTT